MSRRVFYGILVVGLLVGMGLWWFMPSHMLDPRAEKYFSEKARWVLERPERLEVLSLHPEFQSTAEEGQFHRYRILGSKPILESALRARIVSQVVRGLVEPPDEMALCFDPRHGVRAERDGTTVDLVICFSCNRVEIHEPLEPNVARGHIYAGYAHRLLTTILTEAGIPIAK
jgi:hypothetical protein